ncbi:AlbA family DNA-binding domain-containing protein [Mucilaginibacter sp. R-33]|uniref:AlbA family DNA-binding domain-containing protein n=1 Tax=Mucilaginibacter sp. R-33 TaxID=3416711 RepID=UPI003CEEBEB3
MNQDQIIKIVDPIIQQSLGGQEIENLKIDCKTKWWDLKDLSGRSEFLKDTSAIANTFGLDGFIIIGYNDKTKDFNPAQFSDCGLKDSADIRNLIIRSIDMVFDLNTFDVTIGGNKLSVIHIPPSVDKPHVLKVYNRSDKQGIREEFNKIFIRKNSSNHVASKNDIDIMYYDRKNIIPDYKILVSVKAQCLKILAGRQAGVVTDMHLDPVLTFENQGSRPMAIIGIKIRLSEYNDPRPHEQYTFESISLVIPIIVPVNNIVNQVPSLYALDLNGITKEVVDSINRNIKNIKADNIQLTLNSGEEIIVPIIKY